MKTLHTFALVSLLAASSSHADGLATPAIDGVVSAGTPIELIKDGFQGTEGPIALPDAKGRLYVASAAGVQVFDAKGKALGVIALPKPPQNLAFAGKDKQTLYVVGRGAAYRIATVTSGYTGRAK